MVRSNVVMIEVVGVVHPPTIVSVSLKPDKTSASPGETINFFVTGEFAEVPSPEQASAYQLQCDVYVNGSLQNTLYFRFQEGSDEFSFMFDITFPSEGKYSVYVDVNVVPAGA